MAAEHPPGTVVAGYRIDSVVGRGGMGVVYRAYDSALERPVALKVISPELAGDERFRERFLRESRLAASIEHPHILPVHAAGEVDGTLYLVTRYVEGEDLGARLRREGRLQPGDAIGIVAQVASALDAAHDRGLVHRDVKPGNILLDTSGEAYLADFGLTKRVSSQSGLTATGEFVGTLDYLAPEQVTGGRVQGEADQYALACVLYECLAGAAPFKRDTEAQTLWAQMRDPPPSVRAQRPELPSEIDAVLVRALAKEPGERYPTCAAFAQHARAALGLGDRIVDERGRRRSRLLLGAGALTVAGAVAAAAVALTTGDGAQRAAPPAPASAEQAGIAVQRNSVAVIDPESNEIVDAIRVGTFPTSIAVGEGAVWALNADDRTISRIDLETREERSFAAGGTAAGRCRSTETGAAVGFGAVWVTGRALTASGSIQSFLWRIDPRTDTVVASLQGLGGGSLATGEAGIWTTDVARVDPGTNLVTERIPFPGYVWDVTTGEGAVWVLGDALFRVNERIGSVESTFPVGGDRVAVGAGSVWLVSKVDGELLRIDPSSGELIETITLGNSANGVVVGEGYVWVTVG